MSLAEKKDPHGNPELGAKIANFRKKLAISIGQKKITQTVFGEMFGPPYSGRVIASYELGDSEAPATLLYEIWKYGNSIDNIFEEGPITEDGAKTAKELYEKSVTVNLKAMDLSERERLLKEVDDDKRPQVRTTQEASTGTSGKRKRRYSTTGKTKKR